MLYHFFSSVDFNLYEIPLPQLSYLPLCGIRILFQSLKKSLATCWTANPIQHCFHYIQITSFSIAVIFFWTNISCTWILYTVIFYWLFTKYLTWTLPDKISFFASAPIQKLWNSLPNSLCLFSWFSSFWEKPKIVFFPP